MSATRHPQRVNNHRSGNHRSRKYSPNRNSSNTNEHQFMCSLPIVTMEGPISARFPSSRHGEKTVSTPAGRGTADVLSSRVSGSAVLDSAVLDPARGSSLGTRARAKVSEPSDLFSHEPVLRDEVVELFGPAVNEAGPCLLIDATLGGGGHSAALLEAYPDLSILGLDRDMSAIEAAANALAAYGARFSSRHVRFDQLASLDPADESPPVEETTSEPPVVGVLFDLGVSSPQLDRGDRGFSFRSSGPLDMRMDRTQSLDARGVVNEYPPGRLVGILRANADERHARRIVEAIVASRPIATTAELAEIVEAAVPAAVRRGAKHPARKTFQALRIEVNDELAALESALVAATDTLSVGGRLVAISYHSGEDRLVKHHLVDESTGGCACPPRLDCVCGAVRRFRISRRRPITPGAEELERNPRSSAARLRWATRIEESGRR